jgi:putative ABC transport system permease protein
MKDSLQMSSDVVALEYESNDTMNKSDIFNGQGVATLDVVSSAEKSLIYARKYSNDTMCTLAAKIVGVSEIDRMIPIPFGDEDILISNPSLVKGRLITPTDVAKQNNVVVIDRLTEALLYPDEESVGKQITLNVDIPGATSSSLGADEAIETKTLKIIGVVENNYSAVKEKMRYQKYLSNPLETANLNTVIYCPITYAVKNLETSDQKMYAWHSDDDMKLQKIREKIEIYRNQELKEFSMYRIIDRASIIEQTETQLEPLRLFLVLIMIVLLLISGVNAMSTMFFSVKERINEIGIKKALGATRLEILNQFIIEGILIALIAAVCTVVISSVAVIVVQKYMNEKLFMVFDICFTASNMLVPILVAIIYGFAFSVVPSYYGARIKVTDSLRFE